MHRSDTSNWNCQLQFHISSIYAAPPFFLELMFSSVAVLCKTATTLSSCRLSLFFFKEMISNFPLTTLCTTPLLYPWGWSVFLCTTPLLFWEAQIGFVLVRFFFFDEKSEWGICCWKRKKNQLLAKKWSSKKIFFPTQLCTEQTSANSVRTRQMGHPENF